MILNFGEETSRLETLNALGFSYLCCCDSPVKHRRSTATDRLRRMSSAKVTLREIKWRRFPDQTNENDGEAQRIVIHRKFPPGEMVKKKKNNFTRVSSETLSRPTTDPA